MKCFAKQKNYTYFFGYIIKKKRMKIEKIVINTLNNYFIYKLK